MRIYAAKGRLYLNGVPHDEPFPKVKVVNKQTGREIRFCKLADDETGEWVAFVKRGPHDRRFVLGPDGFPRKVEGIDPLVIEATRCDSPGCKACNYIFGPR